MLFFMLQSDPCLNSQYKFMPNSLVLTNLLTIGYIISGTICLFGAKMQNIQQVNEASIQKHFFHPYMQSFMMFLGEALCIFIYLLNKRINSFQHLIERKQAESSGKLPIPKYLLIIPTIADLSATCFQYTALNFIPGSIYQLLKVWGIIFTMLFSKYFIGTTPKKNQAVGSILVVIGLLIVQISSIVLNSNSKSQIFTTPRLIIGSILMFFSMILKGFQFAFEGKMILKYHIPPLLMVGIQGIYGSILSWTTVILAMFIPCTFGPNACSYSSDGTAYLERPQQFFHQVINSPLLISMSIVTMLSIALFNLFGLWITKHLNALARSVLNLTQIALVWIIGIIVTTTIGKNNSDYEWEFVSIPNILWQGLGFGVLLFGTLIFNKNIRSLKCLQIDNGNINLQQQQEN